MAAYALSRAGLPASKNGFEQLRQALWRVEYAIAIAKAFQLADLLTVLPN
jgi:hypothetical protein